MDITIILHPETFFFSFHAMHKSEHRMLPST